MFKYMDETLAEMLNEISNQDLHRFSEGKHLDQYTFLVPWFNDPQFWTDLCQQRYELVIFDKTTAKTLFQKAFLYEAGQYSDATAKQSYKTRIYLHNLYQQSKQLELALANADAMIGFYGLIGVLLSMPLYQQAIELYPDRTEQYAKKALAVLATIPTIKDKDYSAFFFTHLKCPPTNITWSKLIDQEYGGLESLLAMYKEDFEEALNPPTITLTK